MKQVVILALPKATMLSIAAPIDVFHTGVGMWNMISPKPQKPIFKVQIVTMDDQPINCLNKVSIKPHCSIHEIGKVDLIFISASPYIEEMIKENRLAVDWLKDRYHEGTAIASICTGAFLLAETGLLDGKTATTHWMMVEKLQEKYPKILVKPKRLITDEGDLFCSGGSTAGFDLSLYLVAKFCGEEMAVNCSKSLVVDYGRTSQAPYALMKTVYAHQDRQIQSIQKYMEQKHFAPLTIEQAAEKAGMSRRTFERRFKNATGDSPLIYLQRMRVEAAKRLLESTRLSFEEITCKVGYEDASTFRKVFKKHAGLNPNHYRGKFNRLVKAFNLEAP